MEGWKSREIANNNETLINEIENIKFQKKPHHFVDQQIAKIITATFCFYLVFGVLGLWWSNNVLKYVEQGTQYMEYTSNHSLFK